MTEQLIRVLLVEDNLGDARLIREMLIIEAATIQFELVHAKRLDEALNQLNTETFNAVLLDLNLPDSKGFETFTKVYAQAPEVAIIILTGLNDEKLAVKAVSEGAQDYLAKGQADSNLLINSIRYAIARKKAVEAQYLQSLQHMKDQIDIFLNTAVSNWESISEQKASLADRAELTRLDEQMDRKIRKREVEIPELPKEVPVMLLIVNKGGLTLYSKQFLPEELLDGELIGGFITAISSFISEVFVVHGSIERIKHQEYTLLFKHVDQLMFCYVFKGQTYSALQKLTHFIDDVQTIPSIRKAISSKDKRIHTLNESDISLVRELVEKNFILHH